MESLVTVAPTRTPAQAVMPTARVNNPYRTEKFEDVEYSFVPITILDKEEIKRHYQPNSPGEVRLTIISVLGDLFAGQTASHSNPYFDTTRNQIRFNCPYYNYKAQTKAMSNGYYPPRPLPQELVNLVTANGGWTLSYAIDIRHFYGRTFEFPIPTEIL